MISVREYYENLCAVLGENNESGGENENDNEDRKICTRRDVIDKLNLVLVSTTNFESYNQIDFCEDPKIILKMMRGFIDFGAYTNVNIGFSDPDMEFDGIKKTQLKRCVKIIEEFKQSKSKYYTNMNVLQFLSTFDEYNDVSFELIDDDTPFSWIIDSVDDHAKNLFESSLDKGNFDLAVKLIDTCDISKVISSIPLSMKSLKNLINNHNVIHILKCISKNSKKIEQLVLRNQDTAPLLRLPNNFEDLEKILRGDHKKPGANENDFHFDIDSNYNVVYAFYQRCKLLPKLGKEIPYFNLLFSHRDRYILDELVKKYSVGVIKELNEHGYMIGKLISFSPYDKERMIEE